MTALIFSYLFDSSRCLCVFWLLILSNCYLCFAVTLATRGPRAAAAETEGQRGKMAHLRCLSCQRTIVFDYGSELIYICVRVATDAAAGIGSDSTERSQLDGVGSYWTQKEKKTGFSFTWDWHRGTKHLSLTMAVCCPSSHLLLSLFVPSLNHLAAVGQVWDVRLCFKGLRLSQMSERQSKDVVTHSHFVQQFFTQF